MEWNQTATGDIREECLQEIFDAGRTQPQAIAVISGEEALSYRGTQRTCQPVGRLSANAWGRGRRTGGNLHGAFAGDDLGDLGIVKAGAAYVPLDPSYPLERLNFMVRDAKAKIVMTDGAL